MEIVKEQVLPFLYGSCIQLTGAEEYRLLYYVEYHDDRVSLRIKHLKRHLRLAGFQEFQNLMHLQVADAKAHVLLPIIKERIRICEEWSGSYGKLQFEKLCMEDHDM